MDCQEYQGVSRMHFLIHVFFAAVIFICAPVFFKMSFFTKFIGFCIAWFFLVFTFSRVGTNQKMGPEGLEYKDYSFNSGFMKNKWKHSSWVDVRKIKTMRMGIKYISLYMTTLYLGKNDEIYVYSFCSDYLGYLKNLVGYVDKSKIDRKTMKFVSDHKELASLKRELDVFNVLSFLGALSVLFIVLVILKNGKL